MEFLGLVLFAIGCAIVYRYFKNIKKADKPGGRGGSQPTDKLK